MSDLINREQALQIINNIDGCDATDAYGMGFEAAVGNIYEAISEMPSVGDNRWIPVSERLPEENGYYLVSCKGGDIHIDFWWKDKKSDKIFNDKWENKYEYIIIAWMPLPEPYKE